MSPQWDVSSAGAGNQKFIPGDKIPYTLGSDAAEAGDAMAISDASGDLILTDGTNGFAGVLGTQTAAGATNNDYNDTAAQIASGSEVELLARGVVVANVAADVIAGNRLVPGADGQLVGEDSDASGTNDPADAGDLVALTDATADGFAAVRL